jgi:hypothetical protein
MPQQKQKADHSIKHRIIVGIISLSLLTGILFAMRGDGFMAQMLSARSIWQYHAQNAAEEEVIEIAPEPAEDETEDDPPAEEPVEPEPETAPEELGRAEEIKAPQEPSETEAENKDDETEPLHQAPEQEALEQPAESEEANENEEDSTDEIEEESTEAAEAKEESESTEPEAIGGPEPIEEESTEEAAEESAIIDPTEAEVEDGEEQIEAAAEQSAEAANAESAIPSPTAKPVLSKQEKKQLKLQKRLDNENLPSVKKEKVMERLVKLEERQQKQNIRALKKQLKAERNAARKTMRAQVKSIKQNKDLTKQEKREQREQLRQEYKIAKRVQFEALQELNETLKAETEEFIKTELPELSNTEQVELAAALEPELVYELMDELTEPIANDIEVDRQWSLVSVLGNSALPVTGDGEKVVVAIIDTGVDTAHEDLAPHLWQRESCVDDLGISIEGGCMNGGYDFVNEDADPMVEDNAEHGTAVAGIVGAVTNNSKGMASLSNNSVEIMVLKVAEDGLLTSGDITRAITFATLNGANIINMSFGGPTASAVMQEAIQTANQTGVMFTAAAGNYALNNDVTPIYPASYDLPNVISVAALDTEDELATFSNYGVDSVDIAAPGVDVFTTVPGNGYKTMSGTSFSAPMVAAMLATDWNDEAVAQE